MKIGRNSMARPLAFVSVLVMRMYRVYVHCHAYDYCRDYTDGVQKSPVSLSPLGRFHLNILVWSVSVTNVMCSNVVVSVISYSLRYFQYMKKDHVLTLQEIQNGTKTVCTDTMSKNVHQWLNCSVILSLDTQKYMLFTRCGVNTILLAPLCSICEDRSRIGFTVLTIFYTRVRKSVRAPRDAEMILFSLCVLTQTVDIVKYPHLHHAPLFGAVRTPAHRFFGFRMFLLAY